MAIYASWRCSSPSSRCNPTMYLVRDWCYYRVPARSVFNRDGLLSWLASHVFAFLELGLSFVKSHEADDDRLQDLTRLRASSIFSNTMRIYNYSFCLTLIVFVIKNFAINAFSLSSALFWNLHNLAYRQVTASLAKSTSWEVVEPQSFLRFHTQREVGSASVHRRTFKHVY